MRATSYTSNIRKKGKKRKAGKERKRKAGKGRKEKVPVSEKLEFTFQFCHLLMIFLDLNLIIYKMEIVLG